MQTNLAEFIRDTPEGKEADSILRKCVHCGFCNATCPTYQLLGDELDGPRGRIYLIKQILEGSSPSAKTQLHLDRCLTCRACETTCPSGVQYGRLADIGRNLVEQRVARGPVESAWRGALSAVISNGSLFGSLLKLGKLARPLLPPVLKRKIPPAAAAAKPWPTAVHARKMLVLDGCAQPSLSPNTNAAAARVLDRLGITLVRAPDAGCCGAVAFHLNRQEAALDTMRRTIDAWWPHIESGAEAVVMTASGCGVTVKDYVHLLAQDPDYRDKAARISDLTRDLSEVVPLDAVPKGTARGRVAFQSPCTLQHGQQLLGAVEARLAHAGFEVAAVRDAHLCCGSAGTYSLLQPAISRELRGRKLASLEESGPDCIATANIGCLAHLQGAARVPVRHWIEILDEALRRKMPA